MKRPLEAFQAKAEKYARYRWDYAPQALQTIFETARITRDSMVVDIGAGTGILTRHFAGRAGQVIAVEPNLEMRRLVEKALIGQPGSRVIEGVAEAIPLPDGCADLVTAAQAINWFDPPAARAEFRRILKPGGWLAIVRNYGTDREVTEAAQKIYPRETDTAEIMKGVGTPAGYYFEGVEFLHQTCDFTLQANWEQFFGALCTASYAPDEDSPFFAAFQSGARAVFEQYSTQGLLLSHGVTELWLGRVGE